MISVYVNNEVKEVPHETSLELFLQILNKKGDGIAIAINSQIITKSDWKSTLLIENDNVLLIQATQGG